MTAMQCGNKLFHELTEQYPALLERTFSELAGMHFENDMELYAQILVRAVGKQLKQGLYREYVRKRDDLPVMHGTMDIRGTINNRLDRKYLVSCEFDELSEDNPFNRILKSTMLYLLHREDVSIKIRSILKQQILAFSEIGTADINHIDWKSLTSGRTGPEPALITGICRLVNGPG